jgi:hypothetical protein
MEKLISTNAAEEDSTTTAAGSKLIRPKCFVCLKYRSKFGTVPVACCKCETAHSKCLIDFTSTYNLHRCHYCRAVYRITIHADSVLLRPFRCSFPIRHAHHCLEITYFFDTVFILLLTMTAALYLAKLLLWLHLGTADIIVSETLKISFAITAADVILAPVAWALFVSTALVIAFLVRTFVNCVNRCSRLSQKRLS